MVIVSPVATMIACVIFLSLVVFLAIVAAASLVSVFRVITFHIIFLAIRESLVPCLFVSLLGFSSESIFLLFLFSLLLIRLPLSSLLLFS